MFFILSSVFDLGHRDSYLAYRASAVTQPSGPNFTLILCSRITDQIAILDNPNFLKHATVSATLVQFASDQNEDHGTSIESVQARRLR